MTTQTPDRVAEALDHLRKGRTIFEASNLTGAAVADIRPRAREAGLPVAHPGNPKHEAVRPRAEGLLRGGTHPSEVSKQVKVPMGTVCRWSRDLGLSFLPDHTKAKTTLLGLVRANSKLSVAAAAKLAGVTDSLAAQWIDEAGLETPKQRARRLRPEGEKLLLAGKSPSEVSTLLGGIPIQTTSAWKVALKIQTPQKRVRIDPAVRAQALRRLESGEAVGTLVSELGVSFHTLTKWERNLKEQASAA